MNRFTVAVALLATLSFVGSVQALGPAPAGTAIAQYDRAGGTWTVSVSDVTNWYIGSPAGQLNGPDSPEPPLPLAANSNVTDNDFSVGETSLTAFSYTDVPLGNLSGIGATDDFMIHWVGQLGTPEGWAPVEIVPEPATFALAGIAVLGLLASRRRRVA